MCFCSLTVAHLFLVCAVHLVLHMFSQIANTALLLLNQIRYLGQDHQLLVRPSKLIKSVCLLFGKIGGASYIIIDACVCFRELNSLNMEFVYFLRKLPLDSRRSIYLNV